ncbi:Nucleotide-diphospho-sugar transferase family protein [Trifolium repens]|nr:Nucleotide-diphospho-sugar transferase family protein [Trifolium repens]
MMDNLRKTLGSFAMAALVFVGFIFIYNWSFSSFSTQLLLSHNESLCQQQSNMSSNINEAYGDDIDTALAKASKGKNKTLIIAIVNKAYVEQDVKGDAITMLDLFLNSFWLGERTRSLIDNLLIVAVDQTSYDRCEFLRLNCLRLETDGVDFGGEKLYMSQEFIKMMWRRTFFLLEVLKRGYNFIFTDTDIMWLRNPFERLSKDESEDLQISTDRYIGDPWSEKNIINTGFYFVRSNKKTISLFETWYGKKDNSTGKKEQDVLNGLIRGGIFGHLSLKVRFLDTLYFSGFCHDGKDFKLVTTIHANCCRSITAKIADLKATLHDWKKFRKLETNSTLNINWTSHEWCWMSWGRPNRTRG